MSTNRGHGRSAQALGIALFLAVASGQAAAQAPECEKGLDPQSDSPYGYGPRGDRCEGMYIRQVGGTTLAIVSLTREFERYDPVSDERLYLAWSPPGAPTLRIQVRGIQPDLYFGMDAQRPAANGFYAWPTSLLAPLRILQPDIGVLAWTRIGVGEDSLQVYLPVSITRAKRGPQATSLKLVVYPVAELRELYLSVAGVTSDGRPAPAGLIMDREPQLQGYYPPERPIRLTLPSLAPGLYRVEASAILLDGTPADAEAILVRAP
jgi:hypothetical protein